MTKDIKLLKILEKYTVPIAMALVVSVLFSTPVIARVSTSIPITQGHLEIQLLNGAQFRVNAGGSVRVFHRSNQPDDEASGLVFVGTILTVVNINTSNSRVQVRISGATGENAVWNGQAMWVNGHALVSQTTHIGGPAF